MEFKSAIKYVLIIGGILLLVFLSQQAIVRGFAKPLISGASDKATALMAQGSKLMGTNKTYANVSGEVKSGGDTITQGAVDQGKKVSENISQTVSKKISKYISGVTNALAGKSQASCPATNSAPAKSN